jgi:hypothetical protein
MLALQCQCTCRTPHFRKELDGIGKCTILTGVNISAMAAIHNEVAMSGATMRRRGNVSQGRKK